MGDYELILKAISYARDGQKLPDKDADMATAALARIYIIQQSEQMYNNWGVLGKCSICGKPYSECCCVTSIKR